MAGGSIGGGEFDLLHARVAKFEVNGRKIRMLACWADVYVLWSKSRIKNGVEPDSTEWPPTEVRKVV